MFIEIPANKISIAKRVLIHGVGVNDSNYVIRTKINGKLMICPFYAKWCDMITRCYSSNHHKKHPTYKYCSTTKEWLTFSNFKSWMIKQNWQDMDLDKDIINPGNKIYSPENCRFVPESLNNLIVDPSARKGQYPRGVSLNKRVRKYIARININGKSKSLGYHHTIRNARAAYVKRKIELILKIANEQADPAIANGLRLHAEILRTNHGTI